MVVESPPSGFVTPPGVVRPDEVYSFDEVRRRFHLSKDGLREARKRGLRTLYAGRLGFVKGVDLIEYIERANQQSRRVMGGGQ